MERNPFDDEKEPSHAEALFMHIDDLPLDQEAKNLLKSLITNKRAGVLKLTLDNKHEKEIFIDPSKTEDERIGELSDALDNLYDVTIMKNLLEVPPPVVPQEHLSVSFVEARLH